MTSDISPIGLAGNIAQATQGCQIESVRPAEAFSKKVGSGASHAASSTAIDLRRESLPMNGAPAAIELSVRDPGPLGMSG